MIANNLPEQEVVIEVFDPMNKRGYQLKCGGQESEVFFTSGLNVYFQQKRNRGTKRVFLCKKFQSGICRANDFCNSIHACRKKVKSLRDLYPPVEEDAYVHVYSESEERLFVVPLSQTSPTVGRNPGAGILCPESSKCRVGEQCPKVHVEHKALMRLRLLWGAPCCSDPSCRHSAAPTHELLTGPEQWLFTILRCVPLPKKFLTVTKGLLETTEDQVLGHNALLHIPSNKLCRPHLRGECKWGEHCSNVHICRVRAPPETNGPQHRPTLMCNIPQVAPAAGSVQQITLPPCIMALFNAPARQRRQSADTPQQKQQQQQQQQQMQQQQQQQQTTGPVLPLLQVPGAPVVVGNGMFHQGQPQQFQQFPMPQMSQVPLQVPMWSAMQPVPVMSVQQVPGVPMAAQWTPSNNPSAPHQPVQPEKSTQQPLVLPEEAMKKLRGIANSRRDSEEGSNNTHADDHSSSIISVHSTQGDSLGNSSTSPSSPGSVASSPRRKLDEAAASFQSSKNPASCPTTPRGVSCSNTFTRVRSMSYPRSPKDKKNVPVSTPEPL